MPDEEVDDKLAEVGGLMAKTINEATKCPSFVVFGYIDEGGRTNVGASWSGVGKDLTLDDLDRIAYRMIMDGLARLTGEFEEPNNESHDWKNK